MRASIARYWDLVAPRYLELFRHEFDSKPYDCQLLASFAACLPAGARVCDAGCGPCGHVAHLVASAGAEAGLRLEVTGIDISPDCVELARREQPALHFETMDMVAMNFPDEWFAGLVCYYALHSLPRRAHARVFAEFARVLMNGGLLLLALKESSSAGEMGKTEPGEGNASEGWIDDPMGTGERVFWCDFEVDQLRELLVASGFEVLDCTVRDPVPGEIAVRRIYLSARRRAASNQNAA